MTLYSYIYIPIWLDLLYHQAAGFNKLLADLHSNMVRFIIGIIYDYKKDFPDLHSNMVRFIIQSEAPQRTELDLFTFQYG